MRKLAADTFALLVFSTCAGATVELLVVRLTVAQVFHARLAAVPVILATARPYGIYRDWIFRKCSVHPEKRIKTVIFDILSFVSFQAPVYAAVLTFAGATLVQMAAAIVSATVILTISGRPYGMFLDWCRRLFGVSELPGADA